MEPKSNSIKWSMFLKYGLTKVISHKTVETGGKTLVNYVWCKVCANGQNTWSDFTYMILHTHLMYGKNHICNSKIHIMKNHIRLFDNSNWSEDGWAREDKSCNCIHYNCAILWWR